MKHYLSLILDCNDGDIRLSGSVANTEGTVQYCYYSTWGLISDNSWNDPAAQVVCKQLGYQSGELNNNIMITTLLFLSLYFIRCLCIWIKIRETKQDNNIEYSWLYWIRDDTSRLSIHTAES